MRPAMSPKEIRALSDEALNRLAAEKGMGWHITTGRFEFSDWVFWTNEKGDNQMLATRWHPCSELKYAWDLAAKCAGGWFVSAKVDDPADDAHSGTGASARAAGKSNWCDVPEAGGRKDISPARALTEAVMLALEETRDE